MRRSLFARSTIPEGKWGTTRTLGREKDTKTFWLSDLFIFERWCIYSLRVLKHCGAPPASLAKVYTTIVRPVLEYAAPVWQKIPDFLSCKIEGIQKRAMRIIFPLMSYNEALNALNLTTLSDRRAHLCQVYIDRLRNDNHPLHFMLPKQEEVVHNYNLRSGISRSKRPTCRTKRTQEFVTHMYS